MSAVEGGCVVFGDEPNSGIVCEQEPVFAVKISGRQDRKAWRSCTTHLGAVVQLMSVMHGDYRGEFTLRMLPAPDAPDL